MLFRSVLVVLLFLVFLPVLPSRAGVNPDQYLTPGRALDRERVFQLEPADIFELARAFAAREQWTNHLDSLEVLARKAGSAGDEGWKSKARGGLERFQRDMETFCRQTLDQMRQALGSFDPDVLEAAIGRAEALKEPVLALDAAQRQWLERAADVDFEWQSHFDSLRVLKLSAWQDRASEAQAAAAAAERAKEAVCAAPNPVAAKEPQQDLDRAVSGLDGLGPALDQWQRKAPELKHEALDQRTNQLMADGGKLAAQGRELADLFMDHKADVALDRISNFLAGSRDLAQVGARANAVNQALYWHGRAGTILAAYWRGSDTGQEFRDRAREEMQGYDASPPDYVPSDYVVRAREALRLPDGRNLAETLRAVLGFAPEPRMEGVVMARALVQAWERGADELAVSYGRAQADGNAARDCMRGLAAPADEPPGDSAQGPSPGLADDSDTSDAGDDFGDIPDNADPDAADGGPLPAPALNPAASGQAGPGQAGMPSFGLTGVGIATNRQTTSTGYHVFAAGSQLGWSSALCRWSVGPADQTIADQLARAGDHVRAAHDNSLAPLIAWTNHQAIRADLRARADKLLAEGGEPGGSYRAQLAEALTRKVGALAGGVAMQMVDGRKEHRENCESNYFRLGFYLAAAHQAFLIARDMEQQGADPRLVAEVLQDGRKNLQQARNAVYSLKDVALATGRCADLEDLGGQLHKLTTEKDAGALVRDAGMLWREAEQRILAVSQGPGQGTGQASAQSRDLEGLWQVPGGGGRVRCDRTGSATWLCRDLEGGDAVSFTRKGEGLYAGGYVDATEVDGRIYRDEFELRFEVAGRTATMFMRFKGDAAWDEYPMERVE